MKKVLIVLSLIITTPFAIFSQCCSPGTPIGGEANQGVLDAKTLKILTFLKSSSSNDYYAGDQITKPSLLDKGGFNFLGFNLSYGINNRLTIDSELGYFINKTQEYLFGNYQLTGSGLSDISFITKYKAYFNKDKQLEVVSGIGIKIPIGQYQQRSEGVLLPIDVQPTNGAYGYIISIFIYKGYIEKNLRFFLTSRATIAPHDVAYTEINPVKYYNYGDLYTFSLFTSYNLSVKWNVILQTRYELRTQDKYKFGNESNYQPFTSSGGHKFFLVPQINYNILPKWYLSLLFDYPVYQYYNMKQLGTGYAFGVNISRTLDFVKQIKKTN